MPVLDITPEMLAGRASTLAVAYVAGIMLWPGDDDAEQRDEAMKTATAEWQMRTIGIVPAAARHVDIAGAALDAVPPRVIRLQAEERAPRGFVAGEILVEAVRRGASGEKVRLEKLKQALVVRGQLAPNHPKRIFTAAVKVSRATIEAQIMTRYRPAMHLWAAYCFEALEGGEDAFPCVPDRLPAFLAMAEFFYERALALRFPTRRDALIRPGEAWRLPPGLPLPRLVPETP